MPEPNNCSNCSGGCTSHRTDDQNIEEASAAPYLAFAAVLIIVVSLMVKWLI